MVTSPSLLPESANLNSALNTCLIILPINDIRAPFSVFLSLDGVLVVALGSESVLNELTAGQSKPPLARYEKSPSQTHIIEYGTYLLRPATRSRCGCPQA
jgi:hypothetical protein